VGSLFHHFFPSTPLLFGLIVEKPISDVHFCLKRFEIGFPKEKPCSTGSARAIPPIVIFPAIRANVFFELNSHCRHYPFIVHFVTREWAFCIMY